MKNIIIRACSGAVYVALIIASLIWGGWWAFPLLCAIFAAIGATELFHMTEEGRRFDAIRCLDYAIIVLMVVSTADLKTLPLLPVLLLLFLARLTMQLYSHDATPARRLGDSLLAYLYIGLMLALTVAANSLFGAWIVLTMFAMIWLNDTGAFLVGCAIGRHRLFPRLSPKKSWEGFFGGLIFSIAGGVAAYFLGLKQMTMWQLCLMGAVVSVFATWGDLMESMLKRSAGVKDSGHLIPGHGGILDRIDSLLFVGPATLLLLCILSLCH